MAQLLTANNATTTLAGPINTTSTTANLASGTGALFPNPSTGQYFVMTFMDASTGLLNEIVWVTARTGDQVTISRGQEDTTPQNWSFGDGAENLWTSGQFQVLAQVGTVQQQAGNYSADTGSANNIVATLSPVPANFAALTGVPVRVLLGHTNTSTTVGLTVNGITAAVVQPSGAGPAVGSLVAGGVYEFVSDGTHFQNITGSTAPVTSVNSKTGAVVLAYNDLTGLPFLGPQINAYAAVFVTPGPTVNLGANYNVGTITYNTAGFCDVSFGSSFVNSTYAILLSGSTTGITYTNRANGGFRVVGLPTSGTFDFAYTVIND